VGAGDEGLVTLRLTLAPAYRSLAASHGGLSSRITVTFAVPERPHLRASLSVKFLRTLRKAKAKRAAAKGHTTAKRGGPAR
jgi:short subunit fatty acids transporter